MKKRNKKIKLAKLLLPLAVMVVLALVLSLNFMNKRKEQVVAKVNGEKIYKTEIDKKLKEIFNNNNLDQFGIEKLPREMVESLAKDIYAQRKLDEKIKKSNLIKREDIKEKIDEYAKKITRNEYLEEAVKDKVNERAVKDKYAELTSDISLNGKREIHLRHILVKNKSEAEDILKQLKGKKTFAELAEKYSIDDTTAKDGGDLGYVFEGNLIPEFSDFISNAKVGTISKPIETSYGWHIIKIDDFRNAQPPAFESVKTYIEEQLKKEEIHKIYSELTENAKIKVLINLEENNKVDKEGAMKSQPQNNVGESK